MKRFDVRRAWYGLTVVVLPAIAAACDSPTSTLEATTLSVYLKDAPGDVDSVWVQVADIVLTGGEGGAMSMLAEPTELINVTALQESAAALIEDQSLPAGHYGEVRFVLDGAVLQAGDQVYAFGGAQHPGGLATTGELKCPSCVQSGLKVKLSDGLEIVDGDNGLLLDLDVAQSFGHEAGNSGMWVMHPVIHGTAASPGDIEGDQAGGRIAGTVALGTDGEDNPLVVPACGGAERTLSSFVPTATAASLTDDEGAPLVFTGQTEADDEGFVFDMAVSDFDTFALGYQAETTFDTEKLVWTATVDPSEVTLDEQNDEFGGVLYTVTGVTCEAITP